MFHSEMNMLKVLTRVDEFKLSGASCNILTLTKAQNLPSLWTWWICSIPFRNATFLTLLEILLMTLLLCLFGIVWG